MSISLDERTFPARLVAVVDGDTADLEFDLGFNVRQIQRVRLFGINAPEKKGSTKEAGLKSEARLLELLQPVPGHVEKWNLSVTVKKFDKYGGRVDAVIVNSFVQNVNDLLISEGLAVVMK